MRKDQGPKDPTPTPPPSEPTTPPATTPGTIPGIPVSGSVPAWLENARKLKGKSEDDPDFEKFMTPWWKKLYYRSIDGIKGNAKAWCGLLAGMVLFTAGYAVPKHGEMASNWRKDPNFVYLDWKKVGIPRGAFLGINHDGKCNEDHSNHITISDGDCAPQDLAKNGATFNGTGGNQGNKVGTNSYGVFEICSAGWPAGAPLPAPVTKSDGCTGKSNSGGSTQ